MMSETLSDDIEYWNDSYETFLEFVRNGELNNIESLIQSEDFNFNYRGESSIISFKIDYEVCIYIRKKETILWLERFTHCLLFQSN